MTKLFESLPPWRKMHTSALLSVMLDCATAASMKRRSRMAAVIANVPTAAHAARRMKSRRVMAEIFFSFIKSFLDGEVRRVHNQVDDGADTVAHLCLVGRRGEIHRVRDIIDDVRLRGGG